MGGRPRGDRRTGHDGGWGSPAADETFRLHEYSPGFDPERFAAHETFFVRDVRRGWERGLGWPCPPSAPPCSVSRRAESWLWRWACVTRTLRCRVLCLAGGGLSASRGAAGAATACVHRRRHAGAVLPGERDPVGIGPGGPGRGRRDGGACWVARRRLLAAGVPAHGRVGLRNMTHLQAWQATGPPEARDPLSACTPGRPRSRRLYSEIPFSSDASRRVRDRRVRVIRTAPPRDGLASPNVGCGGVTAEWTTPRRARRSDKVAHESTALEHRRHQGTRC